MIFVAFHTGFGGTLGFMPMVKAFAAPLIGIVYYAIVRWIRGRQGMSFGQTFAEIPPE